jgi:hypothetical protein
MKLTIDQWAIEEFIAGLKERLASIGQSQLVNRDIGQSSIS